MSDKLTALFRERLAGHEMDVPSDTWAHVSGQLAASASGESLRDALQDKFSGHEVEVDPSAWANISGKLAQGTAPASSFNTGWIAAGVAAVAITAGLLLWNAEAKPKVISPEHPVLPITAVTPPAAVPATVEAELPKATAEARPEKPAELLVEHSAPATTKPQKREPVPEINPEPKQVEMPVAASPEATTTGENQPDSHGLSEVKAEEPVATPATVAKTEARQEPKPEPEVQATVPNEGHGEKAAAKAGAENDLPMTSTLGTEETIDLLIPNAFSPNGDGTNDKWKVVTTKDLKVEIRIYSMSGALVFQADDLRQAWDGRLPNGGMAEEGNYTCLIKLFQADGQTKLRTGQVHLFR